MIQYLYSTPYIFEYVWYIQSTYTCTSVFDLVSHPTTRDELFFAGDCRDSSYVCIYIIVQLVLCLSLVHVQKRNTTCLKKAPPKSLHPFPQPKMRPLTESETQTLFTKLANYTGRSLTHLIAAPTSSSSSTSSTSSSSRNVFRLHHSRVYYLPLSLANLATSIRRENLLSLGTCLGKFTKTGKFRLHVTALGVIGPHARFKVWIKPNGEMPFLYGGNVLKAHVGRWSEDCPEHQGVVVYSMNDMPLVSFFFLLFFSFLYIYIITTEGSEGRGVWIFLPIHYSSSKGRRGKIGYVMRRTLSDIFFKGIRSHGEINGWG